MRGIKKHFAILYRGAKVGESWAVSAKKAITNYWWKEHKQGNKYSYTRYDTTDFDAVEI